MNIWRLLWISPRFPVWTCLALLYIIIFAPFSLLFFYWNFRAFLKQSNFLNFLVGNKGSIWVPPKERKTWIISNIFRRQGILCSQKLMSLLCNVLRAVQSSFNLVFFVISTISSICQPRNMIFEKRKRKRKMASTRVSNIGCCIMKFWTPY